MRRKVWSCGNGPSVGAVGGRLHFGCCDLDVDDRVAALSCAKNPPEELLTSQSHSHFPSSLPRLPPTSPSRRLTMEDESESRIATEGVATEGKEEVSDDQKGKMANLKRMKNAEEASGVETQPENENPIPRDMDESQVGLGNADEGTAEPKEMEEAEEEHWNETEVEVDQRSKKEGNHPGAFEVEKQAGVQESAAGASEAVVIELPKADIEGYGPAADDPPNENQDKLSELKMSRKSLAKTKRRPACLDLLKMKNSVDLDVVFPAKTHAQPIRDTSLIEYPDGVQRPKDNLNVNGMPGILFRYDRDFLLQFRPVCKDKPDGLRHLEEIGIGPSDQPIGRPRGSRGAQQVGSSDLALPKSLPTNASSNPADPHARAGTADAKRKKSKRKSKLLSSKMDS